jgi:hypothetical protein
MCPQLEYFCNILRLKGEVLLDLELSWEQVVHPSPEGGGFTAYWIMPILYYWFMKNTTTKLSNLQFL